MDGDGDLDVISSSQNDDKIAWYENLDGFGQLSDQRIVSVTADRVLQVIPADMDGDGDVDLYLCRSSGTSRTNWLLVNDGEGVFGEEGGNRGVDSTASCRSMAWADVDGDGDVDLLVVAYNSGDQLFLNDGSGSFVSVGGDRGFADTAYGVGVGVGDVDGDGELKTNMVGMPKEPWGISNNAAGRFGPPKWEDARFTLPATSPQAITLR